MKQMISTALIALTIAIGTGFQARAEQQQDIVDTAVAAGSFKTLAAALQAAGLVETLKGAGPFTVFAPTDAAFAKLPAGTVENLLKPENRDKLRSILTYHVVSGKVTAADYTGRAGSRAREAASDLDGRCADAIDWGGSAGLNRSLRSRLLVVDKTATKPGGPT